MFLTENDRVVEAFPADGVDHSLHVRILPRRLPRGLHFFHAEVLDHPLELESEYLVIVAQEVFRRRVPRERLDQLLPGPRRFGRVGHMEVNYHPALMRDYQEDIKGLESRGRHREEIDRGGIYHLVSQECLPSL